MRTRLIALRKVYNAYRKLSARERVLVSVMLAACVVTAGYLMVAEVQAYVEETNRLTTVRKRELQELSVLLKQHAQLNSRLERAKAAYAESRLTFEEVTAQLDKIVRQSIGSDKYDLKRGSSPEQLGFDYEKQEFSLKVNSLTLEQLVRLLYELEQGKSPLFLGRVDIVKTGNENNFSATLEIFSIRKSSDAAA